MKGAGVSIGIDKDSFPPESFCQVITGSIIPANLFQSPTGDRLSSQFFTEHAPNIWSILYHTHLIVQGQIITDGIHVQWSENVTISVPLEICIALNSEIEEASMFRTCALATVVQNSDGSVRVGGATNNEAAVCSLKEKLY